MLGGIRRTCGRFPRVFQLGGFDRCFDLEAPGRLKADLALFFAFSDRRYIRVLFTNMPLPRVLLTKMAYFRPKIRLLFT